MFSGFLLAAYLLASALLILYKVKRILPGSSVLPTDTPADANLKFEDVRLPVGGSSYLHAWWIPADIPTSKTILYLHGNRYAIEAESKPEAPLLHQTGANLLLVDDRGYGKSTPMQATGASTEADARASMRYLLEQRGVAMSGIWIAGRSTGAGVAGQLAAGTPGVGGVILLSPLTSVNDAANERWWARYLFRPTELFGRGSNFDNKAKMPSIQATVLILSRTADDWALPSVPKRLYDLANSPKQIHMIEGAGHNDFRQPRGRPLGEGDPGIHEDRCRERMKRHQSGRAARRDSDYAPLPQNAKDAPRERRTGSRLAQRDEDAGRRCGVCADEECGDGVFSRGGV